MYNKLCKIGQHIPVSPGALPQKAGRILKAILYRSELPRGDVPELLGASDRHARRIVSALIKRGVVVPESTRATTPCLPGQLIITLNAWAIS